MNKRQKLVQQRFLDNEDAVLDELKKSYKQAQRDIELKTKALQYRINDLQARIDKTTDEERKTVLKSMQQAKIYQKNYQEALKKQVDAILDNMHVEEFKTVSEYLDKCYEEGFLGTMYDLHGQDIPLIFPLDQEAMVRAVQLDSKISEGLYKRLGEDVQQLKKDIASEISRGISTGASFEQIAQQIGFKMMGKYDAPGGALAKAMTIARTEGHRIQNQSSMDTCYKAKEKGADVVKQWDSTLDSNTRSSHQKVDGEVRELDEPFSNGLMYPGDPGAGAGEVVNCRCALLQRARWAMGEEELKTLKQRTEYFGLDKADTFDDFKKKYMKAAEKVSEVKEIKDALDFGYGDFTQDDYNKWWDDYDAHNKNVKLSADELKIIDDYTEGSFIALNDVNRYSEDQLLKKGYSAEDIARIRKKADTLEGALSKYDLDTDVVTHRFERDVSWLTGKGNDIADLETLIGKEYTAKGFTSSGMLPNRFRFTGGKKDAVHFEIVTPKGTNGAFLSMSRKGENEFLYNRNTRFKILDGGERVVKESKLNFKTLQLEEVDVVERFLKVQVIPDTIDDVSDVVKAATVAKKKAFVPAKTRQEAEDFVRKYVDDKQFGAMGVSYSGISVESANMVNETLSNLYETFNMNKLGGVYVAKGNTKLGKAVENATAAYSPIRKTLILNNRSLKNVDDFAKSKAEEISLVKAYANDPSSLIFKSKKAEQAMKASLFSGRCTVPENITDVIHHEMGHSLEKTISKMPGYEAVKANMSTFAEKVSGYATFDEGEYIAESFASYMKGEKVADPEIIKLFEALKR